VDIQKEAFANLRDASSRRLRLEGGKVEQRQEGTESWHCVLHGLETVRVLLLWWSMDNMDFLSRSLYVLCLEQLQ